MMDENLLANADCPFCLAANPDESHYILECAYYTQERAQHLPPVDNLPEDRAARSRHVMEGDQHNLAKFLRTVMYDLKAHYFLEI